MEKTFKEVFEFRNAAFFYSNKQESETKLKLVLEKGLKSIEPLVAEYFDKKETIEINNANEDSDGSVIFTTEPNGTKHYKFTKKGLVKKEKEIKELFKEKVKVKAIVLDSLPKDITKEVFEKTFKGFVNLKK